MMQKLFIFCPSIKRNKLDNLHLASPVIHERESSDFTYT